MKKASEILLLSIWNSIWKKILAMCVCVCVCVCACVCVWRGEEKSSHWKIVWKLNKFSFPVCWGESGKDSLVSRFNLTAYSLRSGNKFRPQKFESNLTGLKHWWILKPVAWAPLHWPFCPLCAVCVPWLRSGFFTWRLNYNSILQLVAALRYSNWFYNARAFDFDLLILS